MYLRPKTTRRLLILGAILTLLIVLGGSVWLVNSRKSAARIARARADAMTAFAKGDFVSALPHFSEYLTASKTAEKAPGEADAEALLAYGKSRQAIPLARGKHLIESVRIFERYLQLKPGDREAQHLLLGLYPRIRYNEEALNLANTLLASDPADAEAMRAKIAAYANQRKFKNALEAAEALVKLQPEDLQAHANVQGATMRLAKPGDERQRSQQLVTRYEELLRSHPDDPRFELLLARAHHFNNDPEKAIQWLKAAAGRNSTDPDVASVLTGMLETYNLFGESNDVLERLASAHAGDPKLSRPLVRRLWQGGRYQDVLKRTDDQNPAEPISDTDLLAYRALALYDLNRPADASAVVEALAARKDDLAAGAWATALRARENENLALRERARQYQEALDRLPENEVIHFFLGEAYAMLGESEPAIRAWQESARLAPAWAAPAAAIARTLASTGRSAEALEAATEAFRRAPKAVSTTTGYVVAWFADQQQNPDPDEQRRLLELVEKIQVQIPREPETLHIYAALLSRTGQRDRATEVIKSALAADAPPLPRDTLLALAAVSYTEKLGLESDILDFAEQIHGVSPATAVRKAVLLAQAGKAKQGLDLLEAARSNDAKSDPTRWALAVLQYRESNDDEGVLAEWIKLGDGNPDNAVVQSAILRSPSRTRDKAFWHRTIDRLKKLTGDEAVTPRVERARWLLSGATTEKDASEAINQLRAVSRTSLPEIHRLLGLALEKNAAHKTAGQRDELLRSAAEELEKAFGARNIDAGVATDLTRVYRAMGRNTDADRVMSRIAERAASLGIEERKRTARTLIGQGQLQRAIEVLEGAGDGQDAGGNALLCSLYRRTGLFDKAEALYRKVLGDERVDAATVADGADFFADRGNAAEAGRFLDKLRSMDVPAVERELLLARHTERHGAPADAQRGYESAIAADATHPGAWQGLVGFYLRHLQFTEAAAAADRGLKAVPDDANLQSLKARALALEGFKHDANLETIADELSNDPQSGAITDMMRILSDARRIGAPPEQTVQRLRELADRNPGALRLHMYVAQEHAKLGQFDEAERVAGRAALRAPNDADAARLLTLVYAARPGAEKWPRVLEAARQWRERSLDHPRDADVAIAQTLLEMRRPADAAAQVKPYVPADPRPDDPSAGVIALYANALIRSGDEKSAAALLTPLAKAAPAWRRVWLGLAAVYEKADPATQWIEQVIPLLSDDPAEQVALAEAWCDVGANCSSPPALARAKAVIEPLTTNPQAGPEGWRLLARVGELSGDMQQAARAYRKLLEAEPDNPDVQNNLAFALLEQGAATDLPEAQKLSENAVAKSPANATYLDTLARIHLKAGNLSAAETAFRGALEAHAGSMEAMIGLADVHTRAGQPQKARELLLRINDALRGQAPLPASLQRQLDNVRQSVKGPLQSGRIE